MKGSSFIVVYRKEISLRFRDLSDQEFRMMFCCTSLADWDRKHMNFGTFEKTIREIKSEILPTWSSGKISTILNSLINKKMITRIGKTRLRVEHYGLYRSRPKEAEEFFRRIERSVQSTEPTVQNTELDDYSKIRDEINKIVGRKGKF